MAGQTRQQRNRGGGINLPAWWLQALARLTGGVSSAKLADDLNRLSGRKPPWDRTAVHRFRTGDVTTVEMMDAFLRLYSEDLPPPMLFARSYEEASRLAKVASKYDPPASTTKLAAGTEEDPADNLDEDSRGSGPRSARSPRSSK